VDELELLEDELELLVDTELLDELELEELLLEVDILELELLEELLELLDVLTELLLEELELEELELEELDELEEELEELDVEVEVVVVSPPISHPYNVMEPTGLVPLTVNLKTSSISSAGRGIGNGTTLVSLAGIQPLNNLCLVSLASSNTEIVGTLVHRFPITIWETTHFPPLGGVHTA